jgi:putative endonuclease
MYHVYILQCADETLYVGSTNNIEKRLHEHNHSKNGAHYTKIRRPVTLMYHEVCDTFAQARSREGALKRLTRKAKLDLIHSST